MDANIGKFLGKYQIVEPLGEGGMATVYKGYDASLERYVAIKIIRVVNQVDPSFLARFHREAKALAKLDHPYILKVLDYGEENGLPYLVMPYVANGTLKQYTRRKNTYQKAIQLVLPIAEALSYAHQRKIIHRDIKPPNILFGESGEPILSDFGIAKMIDARDDTQLTSSGVGIGTPDYMAPEQWNGIADERTDVYALGIVLYELITGRCPFHADTPAAILLKQVQDPLPRPKLFVPDLPDIVEGLLIKALAKDPQLRFQSMHEFSSAMNRVLRGEAKISDYPDAAQINDRNTVVKNTESISQMSEPTPANQSKQWLPWAIGGGAILLVGCLIIVLVTSLWQFELLGGSKSTATGPVDQAENQNTDDADLPTPTKTDSAGPQVTAVRATATIQSVDTIEKMPDDIPVYTPNNGDVMTTEDEQMLMFSYSTASERTVVADFFIEKMANSGWELGSTSEMAAQNLVMYVFAKDSRDVVIYVMEITPTTDKPAFTMIQIMLSE